MPDSEVFEVRWHARGGQGAVTASRFLAAAALRENKHFQGFPEFGTEREGAPIQAFNRISPSKIYWHENVTRPDAVVVLDQTLLGTVDVASGLKEGGVLIVNTAEDPQKIREQAEVAPGVRVCTVDATRIATESIGRPITNTAMVGALVKATGLVDYANVRAELEAMFSGRFRPAVVQGNLKALDRAYEEVKDDGNS
jgi:pyruvate ferredoxin oxidoreductase gamma subunit